MIRNKLISIIDKTLCENETVFEFISESTPEIIVSKSNDPLVGSYCSDIAIRISQILGKYPFDIASDIRDRICDDEKVCSSVNISEAGILYFDLNSEWLCSTLDIILDRRDMYGLWSIGCGKKAQVEYVSANPNVPITIIHGRGAAIGDSIANLLTAIGYDVTRETYVNDIPDSTQMRNFGRSVNVRYLQALGIDSIMPEDGYFAEFVIDIADDIVDIFGDKFINDLEEDRINRFTRLAQTHMLELQESELKKFGVSHDVWFSETDLQKSGKIADVVNLLKDRGFAYEKSGAIWLKSTDFGDDTDKVLVRNTGEYAYIASDAAYHLDKFNRGFDIVIDVWGPDHHGYIARTKAAVAALGIDPERLKIIVFKNIKLFSNGEAVTASKQTDDMLLLSNLMEETDNNTLKLAFLMNPSDEPADIDLELMRSASNSNPVYNIFSAYDHLSKITINDLINLDSVSALSKNLNGDEIKIVEKLAEYPDIVLIAGTDCEPYVIVRYLRELVDMCANFINSYSINNPDNLEKAAKSMLANSIAIVMLNAFKLLGIEIAVEGQ